MRTSNIGNNWLLLAALIGSVVAPLARGDELLPPDRPIAEVIDHHVDHKLKLARVEPAPQADESTLVRRLYLDLAGRIPTANEARAHVASTDPRKRAKLIDELLALPEFVRHNATEFDVLLRNDNDEAGSVRGYLLKAFQENRPWNQMFRDLLGVADRPEPTKPEAYVARRLKDHDALTRDISSVFFGLNITCAQCHRHPYIKSLTQDYFFGMKAFFASTYEIQGNVLDRQYLKLAPFKARNGELRPVKMMFLSGETVAPGNESVANLDKAILDENKLIQEFVKNFPKTKELPAAPAFRPRTRLAELALSPANRDRFAAAIVNRLWHRFHGHGLVMRVDQMHALNEPSHPDLLRWLTRDFITHNYDLKRLIGGLVGSKAYARSSRWDHSDPPGPELFAAAALRPLTPMQWGVSHRLASNPALLKNATAADLRLKALEGIEAEAQKVVGNLIEYPRDDMQINVTESMRLSNDASLLKMTGEQLVPLLLKMNDRKEQIAEAVWTVLSRCPTPREQDLFAAYLEGRKDRPAIALQQLVWALINSPEFRFNH